MMAPSPPRGGDNDDQDYYDEEEEKGAMIIMAGSAANNGNNNQKKKKSLVIVLVLLVVVVVMLLVASTVLGVVFGRRGNHNKSSSTTDGMDCNHSRTSTTPMPMDAAVVYIWLEGNITTTTTTNNANKGYQLPDTWTLWTEAFQQAFQNSTTSSSNQTTTKEKEEVVGSCPGSTTAGTSIDWSLVDMVQQQQQQQQLEQSQSSSDDSESNHERQRLLLLQQQQQQQQQGADTTNTTNSSSQEEESEFTTTTTTTTITAVVSFLGAYNKRDHPDLLFMRDVLQSSSEDSSSFRRVFAKELMDKFRIPSQLQVVQSYVVVGGGRDLEDIRIEDLSSLLPPLCTEAVQSACRREDVLIIGNGNHIPPPPPPPGLSSLASSSKDDENDDGNCTTAVAQACRWISTIVGVGVGADNDDNNNNNSTTTTTTTTANLNIHYDDDIGAATKDLYSAELWTMIQLTTPWRTNWKECTNRIQTSCSNTRTIEANSNDNEDTEEAEEEVSAVTAGEQQSTESSIACLLMEEQEKEIEKEKEEWQGLLLDERVCTVFSHLNTTTYDYNDKPSSSSSSTTTRDEFDGSSYNGVVFQLKATNKEVEIQTLEFLFDPRATAFTSHNRTQQQVRVYTKLGQFLTGTSSKGNNNNILANPDSWEEVTAGNTFAVRVTNAAAGNNNDDNNNNKRYSMIIPQDQFTTIVTSPRESRLVYVALVSTNDSPILLVRQQNNDDGESPRYEFGQPYARNNELRAYVGYSVTTTTTTTDGWFGGEVIEGYPFHGIVHYSTKVPCGEQQQQQRGSLEMELPYFLNVVEPTRAIVSLSNHAIIKAVSNAMSTDSNLLQMQNCAGLNFQKTETETNIVPHEGGCPFSWKECTKLIVTINFAHDSRLDPGLVTYEVLRFATDYDDVSEAGFELGYVGKMPLALDFFVALDGPSSKVADFDSVQKNYYRTQTTKFLSVATGEDILTARLTPTNRKIRNKATGQQPPTGKEGRHRLLQSTSSSSSAGELKLHTTIFGAYTAWPTPKEPRSTRGVDSLATLEIIQEAFDNLAMVYVQYLKEGLLWPGLINEDNRGQFFSEISTIVAELDETSLWMPTSRPTPAPTTKEAAGSDSPLVIDTAADDDLVGTPGELSGEANRFPHTLGYVEDVCGESRLGMEDRNRQVCEATCEPTTDCCNPFGTGDSTCFEEETAGCFSYAKCHALDGYIDPAHNDLDRICARASIEINRKECEMACSSVQCCYTEEESCVPSYFQACLDYAPCQNLRTTTTTTSDSLIDVAPTDLDERCQRKTPTCERDCKEALCCSDPNSDCYRENFLACLSYSSCTGNSDTTITVAPIYSRVGPAPFILLDICSYKGLDQFGPEKCFEACANAQCCFEKGAGGCFGDDPLGCTEYRPCSILKTLENDLTFPPNTDNPPTQPDARSAEANVEKKGKAAVTGNIYQHNKSPVPP